jgi:excisionase family DNA binding protein
MARKLLTVAEAAEMTRLSPRTLYNWASRKKVPHMKVGGRLLFDEGKMASWLDQFNVETVERRRGTTRDEA